LNVQASRSRDTFADEIAEPAASRVLARSPFGYGHDPFGAAAPRKSLVAGVGGADPPKPPRTPATSSACPTSDSGRKPTAPSRRGAGCCPAPA